MALTLSGELHDAQDLEHRNPRVRLTSDQYEAAIPMDGRYWSTLVSGEHDPATIWHSTGRWVGVYSEDGYKTTGSPQRTVEGQYLKFFTSDDEVKYWTVSEIHDSSVDWRIRDLSLVELDDNNIGITWIETRDYVTGTDWVKINNMVVDIEGTVLTGEANIVTLDQDDYYANHLHVGRLGSGETFFLSYGYHDVAADNWDIAYRTSPDFVTWGSQQTIALSFSGEINSHEKDNPFLVNPTNHNPVLFFDYVDGKSPSGTAEVINLYKVETSDDGGTWTSGEKLTFNVPYGRTSEAPTAALTSGEQLRLAYHNEINVLHMYERDVGWCSSSNGNASSFCSTHSHGSTAIHFDPYYRNLWVINQSRYDGMICSVVGIDVDEWEVIKCYSDSSSPALPSGYSNWDASMRQCLNQSGVNYWDDEGSYWVHISDEHSLQVCAINTHTDDIYEIAINGDWRGKGNWVQLDSSYMSYPFIWVTCSYSSYGDSRIWLFVIDLRDAIPFARELNYFKLNSYYAPETGSIPMSIKFDIQVMGQYVGNMKAHPEVGLITVFSHTSGSNYITGNPYPGALFIYSMEGGDPQVISQLQQDLTTDSTLPRRGPKDCAYLNGALHISFNDSAARKGYWKYTLADGESEYVVPDNVVQDSYEFDFVHATPDQKLIFTADNSTGIWVYNTVDDNNSRTNAWSVYNNTTMPGLTPDGQDTWAYNQSVAYDPLFQTVFASRGWIASLVFNGVIAFNINGPFSQMKYKTGSFNTDWTFNAESDMTIQMFDRQGHMAIDDEDTMWLWWQRGDLSAGEYSYSMKWDKGKNYIDLTEFLVGETSIAWELDQPNTLQFQLAEGHLFDPHNNRSIYAMYTERGKKFAIEFGEYFPSGEYTIYQDQGSFILEELNINYNRGVHPTASITCRDKRSQWLIGTEQLTDPFSGEDPIYVLGNLLENQGSLTASQYTLPASMEHQHDIYYQWIDMNFNDILNELLDHFRYAQLQTVEDKFTIKYVDFDPVSVDHEYTDQTKLIDYTPQDQWSVYTNRVIVRGETRSEIEVIYPRELAATQTGTLGWWGCSDTNTHYYSSDKEKLMQSARVNVVHPPTFNTLFMMAGGNGNIHVRAGSSATPTNSCVVHVTAPNLIGIVWAQILAVGVTAASALGCDGFVSGWCGVVISVLGFEITLLAESLGAIASYQYEVYANPVGYVKQTFQAEANDWDSQIKLDGKIITEVVDDPFCYEQGQAKMVAEKTLEFFQYQRWGQQITKVADLRDELLDTIRLSHPFSYDRYRFLINSLTRRYKPALAGEQEGYFIDEIGGWNLDMIRTDVALDP